MRTAEREILRDVVGRMRDEAPEPVPFDDLRTFSVHPVAPRRFLPSRPIWIAVSVAVAVLILGVGANFLAHPQSVPVYLGEGEELIFSDPPIVQGALSPEPRFDLSGLGEEGSLTASNDVPEILRVVGLLTTSNPESDIVRVTVVGETPEGVLTLMVHLEGPTRNGDLFQSRCLTTTLGDAACSGVGIEEAHAMPGGVLAAQLGNGPGYTVGYEPQPSALTWDVPDGTSVVTLTVNDKTKWQRPVAGVSMFVTELVPGDTLEVTAYDSQGRTLRRVSCDTTIDNQGC